MTVTRRRHVRLFLALVPVGTLLAAAPAVAGDGRIEINQACAVHIGCGAGDTAGFPVTVATGSYVLTGSLSVTDPDTSAIQVQSGSVEIDLNGFELAGPGICIGFGTTLSCGPPGTGLGIDAASRSGLRVRNGRVTGFSAGGIHAGDDASFERLVVQFNGGSGLRATTHALVRDAIAVRNFGNGIELLAGGSVEGAILDANRFDGIQVDAGSTVRRSISYSNGDDGINTGSACVVRDSYVTGNQGAEIEAGGGNRVSHVVSVGVGTGITASAGSSLQSIAVRTTTSGFALDLAADASFREIVVEATGGAGSVNGGIDLGASSCNGTGTCP